MPSINRPLRLPITYLFALALALPLGCGGSGTGTGQQNDTAANPNNGSNSDDVVDCTDSGLPSDGGSSHKVTICHFPPGNPANAHTISVGAPAVPAHLAHGDHLGPCGPGEGRCGNHDGGQQDAGNPPDGGPGPDGGPSCLPQGAGCNADGGTAPCCTGLSCINNVCAQPLP